MSDILPPRLAGVQQRSLYVKARTAVTVLSSVWLILAITGFGFFSGGTTSLALSLVLLYGTGAALVVVITAVYRLIKRSALRRAENAPEDTAALAFVDTTRSATDELMAALRPQAATGRQYAPSARTVGPAVSMIEAVAAARAASRESIAAAVAAAASVPSAQTPQPPALKTVVKTPVIKDVAKTAEKATARKTPAVKNAAKAPAKTAVKADGKSPAAKTPSTKGNSAVSVNKLASSKSPAKKQQKPQGSAPQSKKAPARTPQAKGRPANNSGSGSTAGKRPGSADRVPGKKQSGSSAKDAAAGKSGPAEVSAVPPMANRPTGSRPAKSPRPSLVLAASNPAPRQVRKTHEAIARKRAS